MNNTKDINKIEILKTIFNEEEYTDFINVASSNQEEIAKIKTTAIDNYKSNLIEDKNMDLLRYVYQNINYYLNINNTYMPKLSEGIALFVSKAKIIDYTKTTNINNYFSSGEYNVQHDLCNPFEEIGRLLLCAAKQENYDIYLENGRLMNYSSSNHKKIKNANSEILSIAISKEGIKKVTKEYCFRNVIESIEEDLELSNITSDNMMSATTKENRGVILLQLDRIIDLYYAKLDYQNEIINMPNEMISNALKTRFENKIVYAKKNIGVYEKTKRLVKKSQN